jgi:hypothetical protein
MKIDTNFKKLSKIIHEILEIGGETGYHRIVQSIKNFRD